MDRAARRPIPPGLGRSNGRRHSFQFQQRQPGRIQVLRPHRVMDWFDRMEALDDRSGEMYLLKDNPLWIRTNIECINPQRVDSQQEAV